MLSLFPVCSSIKRQKQLDGRANCPAICTLSFGTRGLRLRVICCFEWPLGYLRSRIQYGRSFRGFELSKFRLLSYYFIVLNEELYPWMATRHVWMGKDQAWIKAKQLDSAPSCPKQVGELRWSLSEYLLVRQMVRHYQERSHVSCQ